MPILRQVAEALDYAHRRKIIHRDVKPANVMVAPDGTVKVLDFGLAAQIQTSLSRVSQVKYGTSGTGPYMAPEQWRGQYQDGASDQYALAVLAYELLAGRLPFENQDPLVLKHAVQEDPPPRIEALGDPAGSVLARGLAKERAARYGSCGEFVEALAGRGETKAESRKQKAEIGQPEGQSARGGDSAHKSEIASRKSRMARVAGVAVLALLACLGVWQWGWNSRPAKRKPPGEAAAPANAREKPTLDGRYENSLGMKFVLVPGAEVLFSVWDTRVKDYKAFAQANSGVDGSWQNPEYRGQKVTPTEDCPVVNVSWEDAKAFCAWLTRKEQAEGKISASQSYRLPADWEWSVAVGLNESRSGAPKDKSGQVPGRYPWGTWPPPRGAGNYADATAKRAFSDLPVIEGYEDGYATTSPVGSFETNRYGLYDMGGNVWQWCEDWYDTAQNSRVLRGASWNLSFPAYLLSSYRRGTSPGIRDDDLGFRCVLVVGSSP